MRTVYGILITAHYALVSVGENLYTLRRFQGLRTLENMPLKVLHMSGRTVIDANDLILGRMSSIIAKRLLEGERIDLVNAENVIISGKRQMLIMQSKEFLEIGGRDRGPLHYRRPQERWL